MKPGFVYLMRDSRKRHKIGFSKSPENRLTMVRYQAGDESITLIHVIQTNDMVKLERILHKMHEACRDEGEWFHLDDLAVQDICIHDFWAVKSVPITIFAERLEEARGKMSWHDLSQKTGINERLLRKYANESEPSISKAAEIAVALGVSLDWLAGIDEVGRNGRG